MTKWIVGIASALVFAIVTLAACGMSATTALPSSATSTTTPTTSVAPSSASATSTPGPLTTFGDGTWQVGTDVAAGRYVAPGGDGNVFNLCYWERAKNDSGELGSIIANSIAPGRQSVTVRKGEIFKTNGCGKWVRP